MREPICSRALTVTKVTVALLGESLGQHATTRPYQPNWVSSPNEAKGINAWVSSYV